MIRYTGLDKVIITQERSAEVLCSGVVAVAQERCPELTPLAEEVHARFTEVLNLYERCHRVYNRGVATDETIDQLGK